jgi:hypothetical protein
MTMAQAWERLDYEIAAYAHPDYSMGDVLPVLSFRVLKEMKAFETTIRIDARAKALHWIENDAPISDDGVPYHALLEHFAPPKE